MYFSHGSYTCSFFMFYFIAVIVSTWEENLAVGQVPVQSVNFQIVQIVIDTYPDMRGIEHEFLGAVYPLLFSVVAKRTL